LAEDLIEEFLQNMKRLGFSEDEIITVIKKISGGAMNE
jgi:DNA-binding transcriptional regulator YhcF (GntR family)